MQLSKMPMINRQKVTVISPATTLKMGSRIMFIIAYATTAKKGTKGSHRIFALRGKDTQRGDEQHWNIVGVP